MTQVHNIAIDLTAPSDTTSPSLFVSHTLQTRPPSPPEYLATSLTLSATSLVHAPPATIAAAIKLSLNSLLEANPGASNQSHDGQLNLERILRTGASSSGRSIKQTFFITGNLTQPYATIFEFSPTNLTNLTTPTSPAFSITLAPSPQGCTQLTMCSTLDVATIKPLKKQITTLNSSTPSLLLPHAHAVVLLADLASLVTNCHRLYARYAEMDAANANSLVLSMAKCPDLSPTENEALERHVLDDDWRRIKGTVAEPVEYFQRLSDTAAWGKATTIIDASASSVFSYLWSYNSYERLLQHELEEKGMLREELPLSAHSKIMICARKFPGNLDDRVFAANWVWRDSYSEIVMAFGDINDSEDLAATNAIIRADPRASKAIRGATRGLWRLTPIAPNVCRATLIQQGEVGGIIPQWVFNMAVKSTLSFADDIRSRCQRNGHVVDAEVRAVFPLPPRLDQLDVAQTVIVYRCVALEQNEGGELADWTPITSTSPFVKTWSRLPEKTKGEGERQLAIWRASTTIDCSPREALAWWFDFASRERDKISIEEGNPARLVWRENGPHDNIVATIKKSPFPLTSREFIGRQLCAIDDSVLSYFTSYVDEKMDYGSKKYARAVRARTTEVARFKPVEGRADQCELHLVQHLDFAGHVPVFILNSKVSYVLDIATDIREKFEKDDQMDNMERDEVARVIGKEQQVYTAEEEALIKKVRVKLGMLEWELFEELESPDHLVKMGKIFLENEKDVIIRGIATIDAFVEQCAAWDLMKMSREHMKRRSNTERSLVKVNDHRSVYRFVKDFRISSLQPREWIMDSVWKWRGVRSLEIAYEHNPDHELFPERSSKFMRDGNSSTVHYLLEQMPTSGGVPQTRVTFTQTVNLGGVVPKWAVTKQGGKQLMYLSTMRKRFDKSLEIDGGARAQNVEMIKGHTEVYSAEETKLLEDGEKLFATFNGMTAKALKMASPLTTAKIAFKSGDRHAWGWATTTVRASPEEVLAYTWDTMRRSARRDDDLEKSVDECNDHNILVYNRKKTPKIIADRDFLGRMGWKKGDQGNYIIVTSPAESKLRPHVSSTVRARYPSSMRIVRKGEYETKVEYVIHPDFGGTGRFAYLMNFYTAKNLQRVTAMQEYFQALRGVEEWDADDARAVGEAMCIKTKAEKRREKGESKQSARMRELFKKYKGLAEIGRKYEFVEPMMARVVRSKLKPAGDVKSKLCSVSLKEGETIGRGLAMALASSLTAEAAVDEWVLKYSNSLGELDKEEAWFRPMLNVVAKRLLGEVSWGLKTRVAMGAGLSILDMATDVFVIVGYMGDEETKGYGYSLLGMVVASMVIQLLVVFLQNREKPLAVAKEMLIVLTGMKPAVDCARVCAAQEMEAHHTIDAKFELVLTKCTEMVCESIPGACLQLYVLLKVRNVSRATVGSVLVSATTTGFSSASISFDFDVDPSKRKETPDFYGYIPDGGSRTVIFGCMILNSALLLLIRSFSAAMLMLAKKRYCVAYFAGDMALYLLQKVLRGDFHYWLPIEGKFGGLVSLLCRVIVKIISDFTGVIQFRHPQELGGLYWTLNMFLALLASFACVWVGKGGAKEWMLVGAASGGWVLIFGLFLLLMKKEYRGTFFDTASGKQQIMDRFKVDDDAIKASILKKNKKIWVGIRGEVKTWVLGNWWKWAEEKPKWMTESWLAKVPGDFVPDDEEQAKLEVIRKKGRRRSGVTEALDAARIIPAN